MTTWPGFGSGSGTSVHWRTSGSPGAVIVTAYTLTEISPLLLNPPPMAAVSDAITSEGGSALKRIGVLVAVAAAVLTTAVSPAAATTTTAAPSIKWGPCRTYTDAELDGQRHGHKLADVKRQVARRQCGTLSVPLDYGYSSK